VREARRVVESEGRRGFRDFGAEIVKELFSEGDDDDQAVRRAAKMAKLQEYDPESSTASTLLGGGDDRRPRGEGRDRRVGRPGLRGRGRRAGCRVAARPSMTSTKPPRAGRWNTSSA
jgi:hypothetical protein